MLVSPRQPSKQFCRCFLKFLFFLILLGSITMASFFTNAAIYSCTLQPGRHHNCEANLYLQKMCCNCCDMGNKECQCTTKVIEGAAIGILVAIWIGTFIVWLVCIYFLMRTPKKDIPGDEASLSRVEIIV